jgi:GT2 family glycosyltransferase
MSISIIIPNYNGKSLLQTNLAQLCTLVETEDGGKTIKEIIIVDDASTDDSVAYVHEFVKKEDKPYIQVLQNKKNYGFSSTVNKGVAKASGDLVLLLNTDVLPDKGFLTPLIDHFHDPQIFAVACMDRSIENGHEVLRGRGIGQFKGGFLVHSAGKLDKDTTLWASGGSSLFRKKYWDDLSGLQELYNPFYWEDIDLSYRALKCGYAIAFEKKSMVVHRHEEGAIRKSRSASAIKKIAYRNQLFFVWLNITDRELLFHHVLWLPIHLIRAIVKHDTAFISGFFQALLKLPIIFTARRKNAKKFMKSDYEVLRNFTS